MSKPGPKTMPAALRIVKGGRADRANEKAPDPEPSVEIPKPPSYLNRDERRGFREHAKKLVQMRIMSDAYVFPLACLAQVWWRMVHAKRQIEAQSKTQGTDPQGMNCYLTPNGSPQVSPWLSVQRQAEREYRQWCAHFGLTPSDSQNVSVE